MANNETSTKYLDDLADNDMAKCHECALRNGHTIDEADDCDDGSVGCPDCPFKPK